jgi:tetratricopeptide (TPR) repeat protein
MIKIIITLALFICSLASGQTQYEQGMFKALGLWNEGKIEESTALFERIAAVEKNNWLPNYYIALMNSTSAIGMKDIEKMTAMVNKAQNVLDIELIKTPDNPELLIVQGLINTVWIVFDPMTNGQKLSPKTMELYEKALAIAPNNPRVILSKAEFEIGAAAFWGSDTKPMCDELKRSIPLFENQKLETQFSPKWGRERVDVLLKNCK